MALGKVLYESGSRMHYVYFPTTSIVSLLYVFSDGVSAEIAVVGNDGIVGISMFMGGNDTQPGRGPELMANMLGVRREGVTDAAGKLRAAGLIHYHRGRIEVLDRRGLEARVCECYDVVRRETDRLLPLAILR